MRAAVSAGPVTWARPRFRGRAPAGGEQDGEGGQVGQDLVLAHVRVLRPAGVRAGGAGVAVAAPVGGPSVGPRRFKPAPAPPANQQPGQQVPARPPEPAGPRGAAASWASMKSASLTSAACAGCFEMTQPSGRFHRCTCRCPEPGVGRVDQDRLGRLPVPHLPARVPRVRQDRRDGPQRPRRVPARCGLRPGSAADGHGTPASFNARVIRAAVCPASRCANIHDTTGAVAGSGSSLCARRPHAACALFGCGPASASRYPYGGRPPRYRPCSRVCAAIAVRCGVPECGHWT